MLEGDPSDDEFLDSDYDDFETPQARLISVLDHLGFTKCEYNLLAAAIDDLYYQMGGIAAVYYYPLKGISVHSLANISLTLLDRIYEAFKQGDEAFSVDRSGSSSKNSISCRLGRRKAGFQIGGSRLRSLAGTKRPTSTRVTSSAFASAICLAKEYKPQPISHRMLA